MVGDSDLFGVTPTFLGEGDLILGEGDLILGESYFLLVNPTFCW
ncbi:hypothetical protein [Microcoleus sp. D2_18a_B4]